MRSGIWRAGGVGPGQLPSAVPGQRDLQGAHATLAPWGPSGTELCSFVVHPHVAGHVQSKTAGGTLLLLVHSHPGGPGTLKGHTQQPHKTRSAGSKGLPRAGGWSHSQGLLQTTALCKPLTSMYKPIMTRQRLLSHQCFSVPLFRAERLEEFKQKPDQETLLS